MPLSATLSAENPALSSVPANLTTRELMESNVRTKLASYQLMDTIVTILENFVKYLPHDGAQNIVDDILNCDSDEKLRSLANHLLTAVLVPSECLLTIIHVHLVVCLVLRFTVKAHGKTPVVTPSPRFGIRNRVQKITPDTEPGSQKCLKTTCLRRDNNRCVITGAYDNDEAQKHLTLSERERIGTAYTVAAHIIPFSLGNFSETEVNLLSVHCVVTSLTFDQRWNPVSIWDAIYRCFPSIRSTVNLSADTINDTRNAMTMSSSLHHAFGDFMFTFRPTVCTPSEPSKKIELPRFLTLSGN